MKLLVETGYHSLNYHSYKNLVQLGLAALHKYGYQPSNIASFCSYRRWAVILEVSDAQEARTTAIKLLEAIYHDYPIERPVWLCVALTHGVIDITYKHLKAKPYTYASCVDTRILVTPLDYVERLRDHDAIVSHEEKTSYLQPLLEHYDTNFDLDYYCYYFEGCNAYRATLDVLEIPPMLLQSIYRKILGVKPSLLFSKKHPSDIVVLLPIQLSEKVPFPVKIWTEFCQQALQNISQLINLDRDRLPEKLVPEGSFVEHHSTLKQHVANLEKQCRLLAYPMSALCCRYLYAGYNTALGNRFAELRNTYSLIIANQANPKLESLTSALHHNTTCARANLIQALQKLNYLQGIYDVHQLDLTKLRQDPYQIRRSSKMFLEYLKNVPLSLNKVFQVSDTAHPITLFLKRRLELKFVDIWPFMPTMYRDRVDVTATYQAAYLKHPLLHQQLSKVKDRLKYFIQYFTQNHQALLQQKPDPFSMYSEIPQHWDFYQLYEFWHSLPASFEHYIRCNHLKNFQDSEAQHALAIMIKLSRALENLIS